MPAPRASKNVIAKYLPVYFVLLGIAAVEVFLAYQHFSTGSLLAILLALAVCGGGPALLGFIRLFWEGPGLFFWTVSGALIFFFFIERGLVGRLRCLSV